MTTPTSKVPILRSFQTYLLNVEATLSLATFSRNDDQIQTLYNIYEGPTTCQTPWPGVNPLLIPDRLPRRQLLASILYVPDAKFLDASEQVAFLDSK